MAYTGTSRSDRVIADSVSDAFRRLGLSVDSDYTKIRTRPKNKTLPPRQAELLDTAD